MTVLLVAISKTLLATLLLQQLFICEVAGQEPQAVHPWRQDCDQFGCYIDYYCTYEEGICTKCPNDGVGTTEEDCRKDHKEFTGADLEGLNNATNTAVVTSNYTQMNIDDCIANCIRAQVEEECSESNPCEERNSFCRYDTTEETLPEDEGTEGSDETAAKNYGQCEPCKAQIVDCISEANRDSPLSPFTAEECVLSCDIRVCVPMHFSVVSKETKEDSVKVDSNAMQGSPEAVITGNLVPCSNLILDGERECSKDAEGSICLVEDYTRNTYFIDVVHKCAELGGIGVVFFGDKNPQTANNQTWSGSLSYQPSAIPSVIVSFDEGKAWETTIREENNDMQIAINVTTVGDACIKRQFCSEEVPCIGSSEGSYCDYKWSEEEGFCHTCPVDADGNPDPLACFFSTGDDMGRVMRQHGVESCATVCASSLTFPACKFCPKDINGFSFGVDGDAGRCEFCPNDDVLYPDREFPLFGGGIKCWQVQKFFASVKVNANAANCELAQMMNYVCGCAGPGYAGASSERKKKVLAWLPRIMACFSFLGSSFIIYDSAKSSEQRRKVMHQLLIGLSCFDIFGSIAYAFTTLPISEAYIFGPIYGAHGNDATCKAQGFFIQMGTISAYMNVSLAFYYLLVIKYGWNEDRLLKIRWALFLFPMLVGFAFAFAGIPYYDSLMLWCNNTASYWPDIPVAIAIVVATIVMSIICLDVYQKEKASAKWRGGAAAGAKKKKGQTSLSERVFWQSFWYLMAFYLTWPAYLVLQYLWAGGNSFTNYRLILTGATMVPMQGFWNMLVYIRPRYMSPAMEKIRQNIISRTRRSTQQSSHGPKTGIGSMLGNLFSPTNSGNSGQANGGSSGLKNTSNANSSSEALSKPLSKQGRSNVDANHVITKGEAAAPTEEEKVQEE